MREGSAKKRPPKRAPYLVLSQLVNGWTAISERLFPYLVATRSQQKKQAELSVVRVQNYGEARRHAAVAFGGKR